MAELLRNAIKPKTIQGLADRISEVFPEFQSNKFCKICLQGMDDLGLYERLDQITQALGQTLPKDFPRAAQILRESLGSELDHVADDPVAKQYDSHQGFIVVALGNYIRLYGQEHFDESLLALYEMTKRFSSEGPIRHWIIQQPQQTLKLFDQWALDPNVHVRRLVSESLRPRLPWTPKIPAFIQDPKPVLKYLALLIDDPHTYVRRSVANNLNDIAKDHPQVVTEFLADFVDPSKPKRTWLIKHALRTLIKNGDSEALKLIGVSHRYQARIESFSISTSELRLGESLNIQVEIQSEASYDQEMVIDFIIHHLKANGSHAPKVFKWTQKTLAAKGRLKLNKKHPIRKISTRKYYSGEHIIQLQLNGQALDELYFNLKT